MRDAAVAVNPDVIVLCHGGPLAEPEDAAYVLERTTGIAGFFGASSHGAAADRGGDDREHEALQGAGGGVGVGPVGWLRGPWCRARANDEL